MSNEFSYEEEYSEEEATVPAFGMGERFNVENYNMRGTRNRPSDRVESFDRIIGNHLYHFSRVRWADGNTTVRAYEGNSTTVVHEWHS